MVADPSPIQALLLGHKAHRLVTFIIVTNSRLCSILLCPRQAHAHSKERSGQTLWLESGDLFRRRHEDLTSRTPPTASITTRCSTAPLVATLTSFPEQVQVPHLPPGLKHPDSTDCARLEPGVWASVSSPFSLRLAFSTAGTRRVKATRFQVGFESWTVHALANRSRTCRTRDWTH